MKTKHLTADWLPLDVQDAIGNLEPDEQQAILRYIDDMERDLEREWQDVVEASRRILERFPPLKKEAGGEP